MTGLSAPSQCLNCPPGSSCSIGSLEPVACSPGTHAPTSRLSRCVLCAAGLYQDESNATACKRCDPGDFCPEGASLRLAPICAPGLYANRTDPDGEPDCFECEPGFSCAGGGQPPVPCSPGSFSNATRSQVCTACPAGSRQPEKNATTCLECEAGAYCLLGASAPLPCADGTYANSTDVGSPDGCTECAPGHFCPLGSTAPSPCASGSHAPFNRSSRCTLCGDGWFQPNMGATGCLQCRTGSFCPAGSSLELPANCAPGTFANASEIDGEPDCFPCEPGFACAGGAARPTACSPGYFANATRSAECEPCAGGTHQPARNATGCEPCDQGSFCGEGASAPQPCPSGTFSNATDLATSAQCVACPPGSSCSTGSRAPVACSPGSFSATSRSPACTFCEVGYFQPASNRTSCQRCTPGSFCLRGASAPLPVSSPPHLTWARSSAPHHPSTLWRSLDLWACAQQCPEGTRRNPFVEFMTSEDDCIECYAGFACAVGSDNATACSPGTFNPTTRKPRCSKCTRGTYQDESGATGCKECRRGHFCVEGSSTPIRTPCLSRNGALCRWSRTI